jgi:hypothetical protein
VTDTIHLAIPAGARFRPVATLVLSGVGTRSELPYERVDDLQLAVLSALVAADGDTVSMTVTVDESRITVALGPLVDGSGSDNGLLLVLERLVDTVDAAAVDGQEWITLGLDTSPPSAASA